MRMDGLTQNVKVTSLRTGKSMCEGGAKELRGGHGSLGTALVRYSKILPASLLRGEISTCNKQHQTGPTLSVILAAAC
jgi:hypothetical protein